MKKANRFVGDWLIKQQLAARFLRTRGKPSERYSLMVSDVSQVRLAQIVDESVPANGPDLLPQLVSAENPEMPEFPDQTLTPPDSIKLTVRVNDAIRPTSPYSIPGAVISGVPRELATHVAVALNRETLQSETSTVWHVVAYTASKGFAVVRLFFPKGWKPRTEYDTPPSADCGLMNTAARMTAVRFNRMQMASSEPVRFWQLHIKPLEYPKFASRDELTEFEADMIGEVAEGLAGHVNVNRCRNGELSLQFTGPLSSVQWNSADDHVTGLARSLRQIGQRFLAAASRLDGQEAKESPVSLYAVHHNERMIRVGGCDDIVVMVSNARSDEAAFNRVREVLFPGS